MATVNNGGAPPQPHYLLQSAHFLHEVLMYLDGADLVNATGVCKRWSLVIEYNPTLFVRRTAELINREILREALEESWGESGASSTSTREQGDG
jgi:hypothetical protein